MDIKFGALADSLVEQLDGCGINYDALESFDRAAYMITHLSIRGLLIDSEKHRARKRLVKRIQNEIRK